MREEETTDSSEESNVESYSDNDGSLNFEYPKSWGKVSKSSINAGSSVAKGIKYSFSNFPGDENFSKFNYLSIYNESDYKASNSNATSAYNYLSAVYDNKSVQNLTTPDRETNLFGANIAKKSNVTYVASNSGNIRGVYFFMRDGNGYGADLSLNAALLNDDGKVAGLTLFLWSNKQKELENELNQIQESGKTSQLQNWDKKMDDFMNSQAETTFDIEINQVEDLIGSLSY